MLRVAIALRSAHVGCLPLGGYVLIADGAGMAK